MRALSARSGLPFYPLKTEYITNKNKKTNKMADNIINTLGVDQNIQAPVEEGAGLSQEQMRANLQEMAGNIESKYQDFNSQKFASKNKLELKKRSS